MEGSLGPLEGLGQTWLASALALYQELVWPQIGQSVLSIVLMSKHSDRLVPVAIARRSPEPYVKSASSVLENPPSLVHDLDAGTMLK